MMRSLAVLTLAGLMAMPASAQEDHVWSDERPDAIVPIGVRGARMLPAKSFHIGYRYGNSNFEGLQLGTQQVGASTVALSDIFDIYAQAPFERRDVSHDITIGVGFSDQISLLVTGSFLDRRRGQINEDGALNFYETSGVSDFMADLMIRAYENDEIRSLINLGVDIPSGSIDEEGTNLAGANTVLPFDAQLGTGSVALRPGMSLMVQNPHATVGAQMQAKIFLQDNDRGYRWGNGLNAEMWGAYMATSAIAVTGGVRYTRFGDFSGADAALDRLADPGQDPLFTAGSRVDLPVGVTLAFPEDGALGGAVLQAEWVFPVHQDYDRVQSRAEGAFRVGISTTVGGN